MKTNYDNYPDFPTVVERYFRKYLVGEIGASKHTIRSYRDSFILLLQFFQEVVGIPTEKVSLSMIDSNLICNFLDWLEASKNSSVSTRNSRCAAMKSFFSYVLYLDPFHMAQWNGICSIKMKKGPKGTMNFLTVDGIKCILEQVDILESKGIRNLTMLSLLYNTGARVQELVDLKVRDLRLDKPYSVELYGKGRKKRIVPIDDSMQKLLQRYMKEYGINTNEQKESPLFFNSRHVNITTAAVSYIIKKYADKAREQHPKLIPLKLSPHCFRHSKAMHLQQAGCPLVYIRDLLGHVSIATTEVYARADTEQKRKALENAYEKVGLTNPTDIPSWEKDPKLKEFLKSLS